MSFDTLQRWHETSHINTAPYIPRYATRYPISRISPWIGVNEALKSILPNLDPMTIAARRLQMQKLAAEQQLLPGQIALQQSDIQRRLKMNNLLSGQTTSSGWILGPGGRHLDPASGKFATPQQEEIIKRQEETKAIADHLHAGLNATNQGAHPDPNSGTPEPNTSYNVNTSGQTTVGPLEDTSSAPTLIQTNDDGSPIDQPKEAAGGPIPSVDPNLPNVPLLS